MTAKKAPAAARAPERVKPGTSLCEPCLWDCVQPLGVTVVCPHWLRRDAEQERQTRAGQVSFGFEGPTATGGQWAVATQVAASQDAAASAVASEVAATVAGERAPSVARAKQESARKYHHGLFGPDKR